MVLDQDADGELCEEVVRRSILCEVDVGHAELGGEEAEEGLLGEARAGGECLVEWAALGAQAAHALGGLAVDEVLGEHLVEDAGHPACALA